jgi:phosphoribosyl 1,2-cyclic phosphodiesterase
MQVIALQSGSTGNCIYVEAAGTRLLLDAGISGRQAAQRMASFGRDIHHVDALLVSHDHRDHTQCMGIYQRKFGMPIYVSPKTLSVAGAKIKLGPLSEIQHFHSGDTIRIGEVTVETIPTPHDGADGVGFVVDDGRRRLGVLTDLGYAFSDLSAVLASLDAVVLESNYDLAMLTTGAYPPFLKERIRGQGGHLSNRESAELLAELGDGRLQWACLAHLSEENNDPRLALRTHRQIVRSELPLHVASRYHASDVLAVV